MRTGKRIGWMLIFAAFWMLALVGVGQAAETVQLITIDDSAAIYCTMDVDVERVEKAAVAYLSQNAQDAICIQTITCTDDNRFCGEALDEDGLFRYLTQIRPLSVLYSRETTESETIAYTTRFVDDDTLYVGQFEIETAGTNGESLSVWSETCVNGITVAKECLRQVVMTEAVERIIHIGTQEHPEWWPTGTLIRPVSGKCTSEYGSRGSEFHTGIDWSCNVGTPIVAADSGVVIFAGIKDGTGYGNYIQIDHLNGIVTCYAHNSKLLVEVGDTVLRGETIAYSGATGRATGPHCHFEVKVNGEFQDPMDYLS